jgi:hypothetical protein
MKTSIKPKALYWASFNRFELRLPGQCVLDCSHSGPCDNDVAHWAPLVRQQVEKDAFPRQPTPDTIREELREYGAWDNQELADDDQNWHRLIWIAASNIRDEEKPNSSKPVR